MIYSMMADMAALLHALFVIFVVAGGLLVWRWRTIAWLHIPVATYGILIMVFDWPCPLTGLELRWRSLAGEQVQWQEFLEHYLFSRVGLTGDEWFVLVVLVLVMTAINYAPYRRLFRVSR